MATWISLLLGGAVGYGVYRAVTGATPAVSPTATSTTFKNAAGQTVTINANSPAALQTDIFWAKQTNTQVDTAANAGNLNAQGEQAIRQSAIAQGTMSADANATRMPA